MENKDQIIKDLLRSKAELMANRNERFALIQDELNKFRDQVNNSLDDLLEDLKKVN